MAWYDEVLDSIETSLAGVSGISYATRGVFDPVKSKKIPRWPKAYLTDLGGQRDPFTGDLSNRLAAVTLVVFEPRGVDGKRASKTLAQLDEAVSELLTHTRPGNNIALLADSDEGVEGSDALEFYVKTIVFEYEVERT